MTTKELNETTWAIEQLRWLANKLEDGQVVVVGTENPREMIEVTVEGFKAKAWSLTGVASLNVKYEDADKPIYVRRP